MVWIEIEVMEAEIMGEETPSVQTWKDGERLLCTKILERLVVKDVVNHVPASLLGCFLTH